MSNKNYVLLKDYESPSGKCYAGVFYTANEWISRWFHKLTPEDFDIKTDWFKLKQPVEDKRIEVKDFKKVNQFDAFGGWYQFGTSTPITPEKYEAVKKAIERELNGEDRAKNIGFFMPTGAATNTDGSLIKAEENIEDKGWRIRSGDTVFFNVAIFEGEEKKDVELSGRVRYFYIDRYTVEYFDPIDGQLVKRELELKDLRKQPKRRT